MTEHRAMPPSEAWQWAVREARDLLPDMGSARVVAGEAMDIWRDFMRARRMLAR